MNFLQYIKEALTPGGTKKRFVIWLSFMFFVQIIFTIFPIFLYRSDYVPAFFLSFLIIPFCAVIFYNEEKLKRSILLVGFSGLLFSSLTIFFNISTPSSLLYLLTWSLALHLGERREYIEFKYVLLIMVLILICLSSSLVYLPYLIKFPNWVNLINLFASLILTLVNAYLHYIDVSINKNFYKESRETLENMSRLNEEIAEIITKDLPLNNILWEISQRCIPLIGLEDCVIYLFDKEKKVLKQIAAFGNKNSLNGAIFNPIEINPGQGIVGKCFTSKQIQLVDETLANPDYIVDDILRRSELSVPIFSNGEIVGVLDSEHSMKGFFKERHLRLFQMIATLCGVKITEENARNSLKKADQLRLEALRYKELDELKQRFISNISHDLKTPLSLIKAPSTQIINLTNDNKIKQLAEYINKHTEHLIRVVDQLLQLNRIDYGISQPYLSVVPIQKMIEKLYLQYLPLSQSKNITFSFQAIDIKLYTDSFRLEQIIHNLLQNAFKYSGSNSNIFIGFYKSETNFILKVVDTGPGIAPEFHSKVFDRFFKVDLNNHEGTGIGLSVVKEYAQLLGAQITLKNNKPSGCIFEIELPLKLEYDQSLAKNNHIPLISENSIEGKPLMLIVEDHHDLNNFILSCFESDFECIQAFGGFQALDLLSKNIPDIIITDLMMPKGNGDELILELRKLEQFSHIPILVLTAKSSLEDKTNLYNTGADFYLTKPFEPEEIKAIVSRILAQRKKLINWVFENYLSNEKLNSTENTSFFKEEIDHQLINETIKFVKENIDNNNLKTEDISKFLGLGRNKFQKEIKEATGLTPVEFIRSIRLNEAKRLLESSNYSVSEIAFSVGFNNLSYFTRSFKTAFGFLPSEVNSI